jgi:hypothetical protein
MGRFATHPLATPILDRSPGAETIAAPMFLARTIGFNSNLYVVCATVLPVLFIALTLESGALARAAIWAARREAREFRRLKALAMRAEDEAAERGERRTVVVTGVDSSWLLALPVVACLVLFGLGEVSAVLALNAQHATGFEHFCTVAALVALPVVLVAVAAVSIVAAGARDLKGPGAEEGAGDEPPGDPPPS